MNSERMREHSIEVHFDQRRDAISARWLAGVQHPSLSVSRQADLEAFITTQTQFIIDCLVRNEVDRHHARVLGRELVDRCVDRARGLSQTFEILAHELTSGLDAALIAVVFPQLATLCSEISQGAIQRVQELLHAEREAMQRALHQQLHATQRSLQESHSQFRAIFESAAIGIAVGDASGTIVETNGALQSLIGYSSEELRGLTFDEITHPDDAASELELLSDLIGGIRDQYRVEKRFVRKDGSGVWVNVTVSLLHEQERASHHVIGIVEDITIRRHMANKLALAHQRLADSQETERRYFAQELHDGAVQQLIGIVYQLTGDQRRIGDPPTSANDQRRMNVPTVREQLLDVVSQLRGLIGELRPAGLDQLGLAAALEGYIARIQREHIHGNVRIEHDLDPQASEIPSSVAIALFRVAQEALRNALQHAHARIITVSLTIGPGVVTLCVGDDGLGLPQSAHTKYLIHDGHFGVIGMSERIAAIAGVLTIDSMPGGGTTVCARVPLDNRGVNDE